VAKITPSVAEVAALVKPAEHEGPWEREAPTRHALRRYLILVGHWRWERADRRALALVRLARAENKTKLPAGWDSDGDLSAWIPVEECICCGHHFKGRYSNQAYCSHACSKRFAEIEEWAIKRVGVVGPPRCQFCHEMMETDNPAQEYCNWRCKKSANIIEAYEQADAELGLKIRAARESRGLSLGAVAEMAGCTSKYIGMIERGVVPPGRDIREQLLTILEVDAPPLPPPPVRRCGWRPCSADISHLQHNATYCCKNHSRYARGERRPANGHANGHGHASNGHAAGDRSAPARGGERDHADPLPDPGCAAGGAVVDRPPDHP
jgi:hypothetical protein